MALNENIHDLVDTCQFGIQNCIRNRLHALGIDYQSDPILAEALNLESLYGSVQSISSDHLLQKYCRENLNLVEPVPIHIDVVTGDNTNPSKVLVGHYVPILPNVSNYLQHTDVWASYQSSRENCNESLYDYDDGLVWKSRGLHNDHLRLHLYTDEFEVCNPIGSRKGVHKMCAFYYTVGNVEVKFRSQLRNIHLAMLINYKCLRSYGYEKVLQPLMNDLKKLQEQGINVTVDGEHFLIKGSVVTLSGDNLSMHGMGGFNPVFNSGRICRHCMVCYSGLNEVMCEDNCKLRTSGNHTHQVASVLADSSLKAVYGVYGDCPLTCLDYFDPIECLPPDVMHDILEGVMVSSVELVVNKLVLQRVVSMKDITRCMQAFYYSHSDTSDKPLPLPEDFVRKKKSVSGKAVEKWCLFRLLPLYIGNLVPDDCPVWKLYLLCRQICDIVLAPVVKKDEIHLLEVLIAQHHQLLAEIGPSYFKPKMHYLVHYPRLMLMFGPLRHLWSMRFEANHQYFKQMSRRVRNYRNITFTLTERYQRRKCSEQMGSECLGSSVNFANVQKPLKVHSLPQKLQEVLLAKFGIAKEAQCKSVAFLTVDGCKFFVSGLLPLPPGDDLPNFLQISHLVHHMGLWIVCGKLVVCDGFNTHYHAYTLKHTVDEWLAIVPSEAATGHPVINSYRINDTDMVVLRHNL